SAYKQKRYACGPLRDEAWQKPVLTQPAAIKIVADFAREIGAAKFFDAGDVQANGFQIVEDDRTGDTFTEAGASYMGFAASALLGGALADNPRYGIAFCGDGSFMMNPQILIDAVEHRVRGMIVILITGGWRRSQGCSWRSIGPSSAPTIMSRSITKQLPRRWPASLPFPAVTAPNRFATRCARRTSTTGFRSSTFRCTAGPMSWAASARGASGTSATGAKTCRAPGRSRISSRTTSALGGVRCA